jgi:hypothetical protein
MQGSVGKQRIYVAHNRVDKTRKVSKPRDKRNYTQARKLKEKGYVFS